MTRRPTRPLDPNNAEAYEADMDAWEKHEESRSDAEREEKAMNKQEKLELILSVIGTEWITYKQIKQKINHQISVGGISVLIWKNIKKIEDKIEWDTQWFGEKEWQHRMIFRKK